MLTEKGKLLRNERYNILIVSETDARTRPVNFNIGRRAAIGVLTAIAFFIVAVAVFSVFLIVRNINDDQTIAAMGDRAKDQISMIDRYARELQILYDRVFNTASNEDAAKTPEPSRSPDITQDLSLHEMQEEPAKSKKYKGKIGDTFTLSVGAETLVSANADNDDGKTPKIKYKSSNARVAKVSGEGEVTLTGPGSAVITLSSGKVKNTVCDIICESQFKSVHYRQGDVRWRFPIGIKERACIVSSFAIMLENAGIHATPRTVYNSSGLSLNYSRLSEKFGITFVNALADDSKYLKSFDGSVTTIKDPAVNYVAAMKEALDRHPEGVCVYFSGRGSHMIVAVGYVGNDIYYSDPGRAASKGYLVKFPSTWVYYKHKMTYKHVAYFVAFQKNKFVLPDNTIVTTAKEK